MATANFSDRELAVFRNAGDMGSLLEAVRLAGGGVPLRITSGDRTPTDTARVGGRVGGCHEQGMAADIVPLTEDRDAWARSVGGAIASGALQVGEFIWYPFDGHAHVTLFPCGGQNETLAKAGPETGFTSLAAFFSTGGAGRAALPFVLALLILFLVVSVR